jgi:hypothetical protein
MTSSRNAQAFDPPRGDQAGVPLVWAHLIQALRHSASLGMDNCLNTNRIEHGRLS